MSSSTPPPSIGSFQPLPQQPHWTQPPPSPPIHTPTGSNFPRSAVTDATLALSSLHIAQQPIPLPTPSPSAAQTAGTVLSPPTPAPSPSPSTSKRQAFRDDDSDDGMFYEHHRGDGGSLHGYGHGREGMSGRVWKGKGRRSEQMETQDLLRRFGELPPSQRFAFLSGLIGELRLNEALAVSRKIEPLLRRDFLRELPAELALHCLSFVDEPRTLARAAQVSRHWNELLQDEHTWKDLFERHGYPAPSSFTMPTAQRRKSNNPSTASAHPSNSNRSHHSRAPTATTGHTVIRTSSGHAFVSRATPFGLEKRVCYVSSSKRTSDEATFKNRFKNAYLTETNWLSGGRILASHISIDDVVVTTLCFDDSHIIVGMNNSKIHIFDAMTGAFRRTLIGHRQGVWAMVLVCANPRGDLFDDDDDGFQQRNPGNRKDFIDDFSNDPFYGRSASDSYRDNGQSRRSSFAGPSAERHPPLGSYHPSVSSSAPGGSPSTAGSYFFGQPARPNTAMGFTPVPTSMLGMGSGGRYAHPGDEGEETFQPRKMRSSDPCGSARGWPGNRYNLVVSAGCDREVKVWNVDTGDLVYSLRGHTSTIRCLKVLDRRPIAVSGSRDRTLRVWDIERGELLHELVGHEESVRCVEIAGNVAVSGSYDFTARVWNLETGECVHVLRGHYHQIYSVAFDGVIIVTGSLDSTIRVWSAATGECLALLQGHTALVGQLQLSGSKLITGGSDGRVIIFDLSSLTTIYRLCAHDNSVTCLQFDDRFIVSGGNDGRVKLWEVRSGRFVRELTRPCDAVWRVGFRGDRIVLLCQREGRTCLEVVSFRPSEDERAVKGRAM
ncbi:hypothetical protein I316_07533 [Kwoniella heveanensis BCC8398]|uniref:F-box domain-containing protein n=1 Tax=Kwoniella heveanensis BCC8398 TaxID=1296120 RepID=A0A1B9GIB5_9TREE|nr:hypothetical protein I316_07533 [Kwoniella heveanensis BCC8398]